MTAAGLTFAELSVDPYPAYAALRSGPPAIFAPRLGLWLVTGHDEIREVLLDAARFVVGTSDSLLFDTFGEHMLTTDGDRHRAYRDAQMQAAFMPRAVRANLGEAIARRVQTLVDAFVTEGGGDLRHAVAARLPVQVMLNLFGLPQADEALFRGWYDGFEAALANHGRDPAVRARAAAHVSDFHAYFQQRIEAARHAPGSALLDTWLAAPDESRLDDAGLRRNALIVFFGGISTVEALTLNTLWALLRHPEALAQVQADPAQLEPALEETLRWLPPVQAAMRHTLEPVEFRGVRLPAGASVNCLLAAGNRDARVFEDAEAFRLDRLNARRHLAFAVGPHHCIGQHLARAEATAVLSALLLRAPALTLAEPVEPEGHEFRQPRSLRLAV